MYDMPFSGVVEALGSCCCPREGGATRPRRGKTSATCTIDYVQLSSQLTASARYDIPGSIFVDP
jgi:hypothetical protein